MINGLLLDKLLLFQKIISTLLFIYRGCLNKEYLINDSGECEDIFYEYYGSWNILKLHYYFLRLLTGENINIIYLKFHNKNLHYAGFYYIILSNYGIIYIVNKSKTSYIGFPLNI